MMLSGGKVDRSIATISTGAIQLDKATGVGGYPRGRIVEVFGPEGGGKTTLALHAIEEAQSVGGTAAFVDAEHALDLSYAKRLGVNVKKLPISQPDHGEQALEIVTDLVEAGIDLVVVDSVAALTPKAEVEGEMGDSHVGLHARLMSQAMRKIARTISQANAIVIFINQLRMKIGIRYGSPEVTTGGNALKYYASMRLDVRRRAQIKDGDIPIGNNVEVKIVKNKVAPPFQTAELELVWGQGIDKAADLLAAAVNLNIVSKSGAWFSYGGTKLGQGFNNAKIRIDSDVELCDQLRKQTLDTIWSDKANGK